MEAKTKQAEELGLRGQMEGTVQLLMQSDARQLAADLARQELYKEAGFLLLSELEDLIYSHEDISGEQKQTAFMAVSYFQKAGCYSTAIEVLVHLGELGQIQDVYQACWERYGSCSPKDPAYKEACQTLISVACSLREIPSELAVFLSSYLAAGPGDDKDAEAFYLIGIFYFQKELHDHAHMIFRSLMDEYRSYKDVARFAELLDARKRSIRSMLSRELANDASPLAEADSSETKNAVRPLSNGVNARPIPVTPPSESIPVIIGSTIEVGPGMPRNTRGVEAKIPGNGNGVEAKIPGNTNGVGPETSNSLSSQGPSNSLDMNVAIQTMEHAVVQAIGSMNQVVVRRRLGTPPRPNPSMTDGTIELPPVLSPETSSWLKQPPTSDTIEHESSVRVLEQERISSSPTLTSPVHHGSDTFTQYGDGSDALIQMGSDATQEQETVNFSLAESYDMEHGLASGYSVGLGDLVPGEMVGGRYKIINILGRGGMATVYRAMDTELDEEIALKVFEVASNFQEGLLRLKKELKLSRRLSHPNIIRLHDIGGHRGFYYLSMELLEGIDLETLLEKNGVVPIKQGLDLMLQVCQGLQAVHEKGVIHRDLKPSNIFLTKEGVVKLMDFGIATHHTSTRLTAEGVVVGTAAYMAPERVTGRRDASILGDMYALGVIAFEIFTGQLPYYHEKIMHLFLMHVNHPIPSPRNLNHDIPLGLAHIIKTLMSKNPKKRIPTCADLAAALRSISGVS